MLRLQRDPGGRRESGAGMRRESGSPSKFALDQLAHSPICVVVLISSSVVRAAELVVERPILDGQRLGVQACQAYEHTHAQNID